MIKGNAKLFLQINCPARNKAGGFADHWETVQTLDGWLDLAGGEAKYNLYSTKVQESTHIFMSDYRKLDPRFQVENGRAVDESGMAYDVMLIDDPMGMHMQWEIYLKHSGGVAGGNTVQGQQCEGESGV